jgi:nitrite reductase/ring-hydroxylating ferredoxin subunit
MNNRRAFIKNTCIACTGAALGVGLLESCTSIKTVNTTITNNTMTVAKAEFAAATNIKVRNLQLPYDVLLVKENDDNYYAMYMQCSHADNPVYSDGTKINCPSHGSVFNMQGTAIDGPADKPLKRFKTELTADKITIHLK